MNTISYLSENRMELLRIFSEISASQCLEQAINPGLSTVELDRKSCMDAIATFKYNKGEIEFPIVYPEKFEKIDEELAIGLHTLIFCEEGVKEGVLVRQGSGYSPVYQMDKDYSKYGKFITVK